MLLLLLLSLLWGLPGCCCCRHTLNLFHYQQLRQVSQAFIHLLHDCLGGC
jgi:hypothetical protein